MADNENLSEMIREFAASLALYCKQRGRELAEETLVEPIKRGAAKVVALSVVTLLVLLGAVFLLAGGVVLLAEALDSFGLAYVIVGLLALLIAGLVFMRSFQSQKGAKTGEKHPADGENGNL